MLLVLLLLLLLLLLAVVAVSPLLPFKSCWCCCLPEAVEGLWQRQSKGNPVPSTAS
jgi:hypothetical protein